MKDLVLSIDDELYNLIAEQAEQANIPISEMATSMIALGINPAVTQNSLVRIEELLASQVMPRLMSTQQDSFAVRHQVTNLHSDILEEPDRAIEIADEATELGYKYVTSEE